MQPATKLPAETLSKWPYELGLHDLGGGCFAYLQPDKPPYAGWSNSGFIQNGGDALLIDTLRDERLTAEMLRQIKMKTGVRVEDIRVLVNTHRDADHTFGNSLLPHAEIIATDFTASNMRERAPAVARFPHQVILPPACYSGSLFRSVYAFCIGMPPCRPWARRSEIRRVALRVLLFELGSRQQASRQKRGPVVQGRRWRYT